VNDAKPKSASASSSTRRRQRAPKPAADTLQAVQKSAASFSQSKNAKKGGLEGAIIDIAAYMCIQMTYSHNLTSLQAGCKGDGEARRELTQHRGEEAVR
jgi:hypothetical protein